MPTERSARVPAEDGMENDETDGEALGVEKGVDIEDPGACGSGCGGCCCCCCCGC